MNRQKEVVKVMAIQNNQNYSEIVSSQLNATLLSDIEINDEVRFLKL